MLLSLIIRDEIIAILLKIAVFDGGRISPDIVLIEKKTTFIISLYVGLNLSHHDKNHQLPHIDYPSRLLKVISFSLFSPAIQLLITFTYTLVLFVLCDLNNLDNFSQPSQCCQPSKPNL